MLEYKYRKLAEEFTSTYNGKFSLEELGNYLQKVVNSDIRRQVAFKGAIEMLAKSPDEWNSKAVIDETRLLTDEFEKIILDGI